MPVELPEQIDWDDGVAVATGFGFTVMVTDTGVPVQPPTEGVIVYTTVPADVPVAVSVWAMDDPEPAVAPLAPDWLTVQLKTVPLTVPLSAMDVALPEQMVCDVGVAVTFGVGLTVTVTVTGVPEQPFAVGVIVYTAVPATEPVVLSVCTMLDPLPDDAPDTPVWATVQENVVPVILLVREIDVEPPEQNDCEEGVAVATGFGFTVIVTDTGVPEQPPTLGVTV